MLKHVVISMHDAAPRFTREIEAVMQAIPQKKSFLVTPCWHGKEGLTKDFAALLKEEDKLLHGLTHHSAYFDPYVVLYMNKTLSREFLYLNYAATKEKIVLGKQLFKHHMGASPQGFVPPMWHHSATSMAVLKELGFGYTETWQSLINLRTGHAYQSLPLSLDYGNNTLLSHLYLKSWNAYLSGFNPLLIRLAIHPSDVHNGMLNKFKSVVNKLEDNNYTFLTYKELLTAQP